MTRDDDEDVSLGAFLASIDLSSYEHQLSVELKLRHARDLEFVDESVLLSIGMTRPEQKRLRKEFQRRFPSTSIVGKLKKKMFGGKEDRRETSVERTDMEQHVIPIEKITLCKSLGQGEFGSVFQAVWQGGLNSSGDMQVAVKRVSAEKMVSNPASFLQEAAIMHRMRHPHVVSLFGVVLDTKTVMLVSELASCGSLLGCLQKTALRDSFPVDVLCDYSEQIADGMAYLEEERLIHRDLAARNVLVFSPKVVKISDFGLSRSLGMGEDYYRSEFTPSLRLPIAWCAPESINFLKFTSASDVWSYAVTLWEMFSYGETPWKGLTGAEILNAVDRAQRTLERPQCCPEEHWMMMKECWRHDAAVRPSFSSIVARRDERLPQRLKTVVDSKDPALDHLRFIKGEIIIVLNRTPECYPDGYYWWGAMKNGRVGLFRPTDTVAFLGAETPQKNTPIAPTTTEIAKPKEKSKEKKKEKERPVISGPQGDLRHTFHVGSDGGVFGLLQLEKDDLSRASSVPSTSTSSCLPSSQPSPISLSSTTSETSKSSLRMPSAPPLPSSCCSTLSHSSITLTERSSPSSRVSFVNPPYQQASLVQLSPLNNDADETPSEATTDTFLMDEAVQLSTDLTNFSLSTIGDFSDTRPLLSSSRCSSSPPLRTRQNGNAAVRVMSETERARWEEKTEREHRKAEKILEESRRSEERLLEERRGALEAYVGIGANPPAKFQPEWSPEAQEAYKLLVQCGDGLAGKSPAVQPSAPPLTTSPSRSPVPGLPPKGFTRPPPGRPPKPRANGTTSNEGTPTGYDNVVRRADSMPPRGTPPPVPPKPKQRTERKADDYAGSFAPAIARSSSLFANRPQEVIKF